ncbi:MAG: RNA-binding cell elongation regulator Jag/EloR [Clostridia bacterium]|nr:RNA-binding cell elongation regulator Jag/EloR [Clostridia bacterium]
MQFTGKTVDETVKNGLKELGVSESEVEIEIIEEPTKGLFGKLKGKAVVEITVKEKVVEFEQTVGAETVDTGKAVEFVQKVLDLLDITAKAEIAGENRINLIAADGSEVIGYRGEVLDAIQTLAGAVANTGKKDYVKVVVDCENYRERREETLIKLAKRLEEKATEMRREVILEPMNPFERRIIHTALSDSETVTTKSEGKEPNRYVVIVPNDKDEYSRPYNAGRNGSKRDGGHGKRFDRRGGKKDFKGGRRSDRKGGFTEQKRSSSFTFGTYLGNSLKDKE